MCCLTKGPAYLFFICIILSACSNKQTSTETESYPSQFLVKQGKVIEQEHSISQLARYMQTPTDRALLPLFIDENKECEWHLSKWDKNSLSLGFLLDCDDGLEEVIFKGKFNNTNFTIADIYHHNMGIWLSQFINNVNEHSQDKSIWAQIMRAIANNNDALVLNLLSKIKHPNYMSQILSVQYSYQYSDVIASKLLQHGLHRYPQQVQAGLFTVQAYIKQQNWEQALEDLQAIENKVGTSELSQLLRSKIYWYSGNIQQAYHHAIHTYRYGIRTSWPIIQLIGYSIEGEDFPAAIQLLDLQYGHNPNWNSEWLLEFKNGQKFIQHPSYIQWQQSVLQ